MTSAGNPKEGRGCTLILIILGMLALTAAVVLGPRVAGVVLASLNPPLPPIPPMAVEFEHHNLAYGVDEWTYRIEASLCAVVDFYTAQRADCHNVPVYCNADRPQQDTRITQDVTCTGKTTFSVFEMRWQSHISAADILQAELTQFRVSRAVSWSVAVP